jgi:uncharacterized protein (DUF885 family)
MKDNNRELEDHLKDYWEFVLRNNPTFATYIGDHRYDDVLEDMSESSLSEQVEYFNALLKKTEKIDEASLTEKSRLNYDLINNSLNNHISMYNFKTHYIPLDQMQGPHIDFPQIVEYQPFRNLHDIGNYQARLHAFPRQVDQVIENLQCGIKHKYTAFRKNMEQVLQQVEAFTKFAPEDNPLFAPMLKLTDDFSKQEKEESRDLILQALSDAVTPAYKKLFGYLSSEYMRHCRDNEGIWSLPDGTDMYRFFARYHTTTDLLPEEIHEIGKREVERIGRDIKRIIEKFRFKGSIRDFANHMKEKKALYPKSGREILEGYRGILSQMDKRLPDFFGRLPKATYDIKEIEKYREQSAPAAYYYPPPRDFSRPGYFYTNTYMPEQRPLFIMEALAYHEAVPGHHLQIAIMQEQEDMHDFRRYEGSTAFIEGWALYAEKLSKEMDFYQDDSSEYGRLNFEIWRAVRLVVDTGLHYYKWGRDKAIRYCLENSGEEEHEIEVEVDRYIAIPGQALAYKTGELKILELREKAKEAFGVKFDIKDFHDRLLENGALPLYELEKKMSEWMKCGTS